MKSAFAISMLAMLAAPVAPHARETTWFRGVNHWGAQGVWRTDAATAPVPGDFVFSLRESLYVLHDVFSPGDTVSALNTFAGVAWTPLLGLQVGLAGSFINATYASLATYNIRSLGNPMLRIKYGHAVGNGFALGLAGHFGLPTYQEPSNATQLAYVLGVKGLVSYSPSPVLELHLNVGFVGDRSAAPFVNGLASPQRFVLGVNNNNHLDYAVGAVGRIASLFVNPFLEVSGSVGGASGSTPFTARVTPGIRLDTAYGAPLEAAVGAHLRLTGEPSNTADFAGLPQWELFVQVALHVLSTRGSTTAWDHRSCTLDAECATQMLCVQSVCTYQEVHTAAQPAAPPPPLVLHGAVLEARTHAALPRAQVVMSGATPQRVDDTGHYRTGILEPSGKLLTLTASAPGYVTATRTAIAQRSQSEVPINFELELLPPVAPSAVRGPQVRGKVHVQNGNKPIVGANVFVQGANVRWTSDANGSFGGNLPEGAYDVVITAKQYADQHRHIELLNGENTTLDVELRPAKKGRR